MWGVAVKATWAETLNAPPHKLRLLHYQRRIRTTPPTSKATPINRGKSIGRS
jgi:hypothetical protein